MKEQEIIENNKLLAAFEKAQYVEHSDSWMFSDDRQYKSWRSQDLLYHQYWNWLMKLVSLIEEKYKGEVDIYHNCCTIGVYPEGVDVSDTIVSIDANTAKSKIEAVYLAVIEFIKWKNAQVK